MMAALRAFLASVPHSPFPIPDIHMRTLIAPLVPFAIWIGVLELPVPLLEAHPPDTIAGFVSLAVALTGLTVGVYRLGVWREQMNSTKSNVTAEVARHREESHQHFTAIERRLTSIEQHIRLSSAGGVDDRAQLERWKGRVDATLEMLDETLDEIADRMEALAAPEEAPT